MRDFIRQLEETDDMKRFNNFLRMMLSEYEGIDNAESDIDNSKFNMGDTVRFIKDTSVAKHIMRNKLIGQIGTIEEINTAPDGDGTAYSIPMISEGFYFTDDELELMENIEVYDEDEGDVSQMGCRFFERDNSKVNSITSNTSIKDIYSVNIGSWIGVTMQDGEKLLGELISVEGRDFIIRDESGLVNLFRYEEVARLICKPNVEDFYA